MLFGHEINEPIRKMETETLKKIRLQSFKSQEILAVSPQP